MMQEVPEHSESCSMFSSTIPVIRNSLFHSPPFRTGTGTDPMIREPGSCIINQFSVLTYLINCINMLNTVNTKKSTAAVQQLQKGGRFDMDQLSGQPADI